MSRWRTLALQAALIALLAAGSTGAAERPVVTVGMIVDGPWAGNDDVRDLTISEVGALTSGEFDVRFPESAYLIGNWTVERARENLSRLLDDPDVDLVITWGLLASHSVCCYGSLPKPVVAPVVIDVDLQGIPYENGTSGLPNLNYVALPDDLVNDILTFREVVSFDHVAILTNAALVEAIPELAERTAASLAGLEVGFDFVPVGDSVDDVLAAIGERTDAVYAWPLFHLAPPEFERLVDGLNALDLPTFSALGGAEIQAGMLVSNGDAEFFRRLTRRVALNIQRILLGEDAGTLAVDFAARDRLTINMATARAIGVSPRWEVMIEAELVNAEEVTGVRRLSVYQAIEEALQVNMDLAVRARVLASGEQRIATARSELLPHVDLSAGAVQIDENLALASFGSRAERTLTGSATISQVLFSDPAFGNLAIQRFLQEGREYDLESLRLDVALEAGTAYLELMRARALERVRKNNVQQIRSNLELARVRRELGVAAAGEVLRWENQLATARKALVESISLRRTAEIAVNRVLHRPLEERFLPEEVTIGSPGFPTDEGRFRAYIDTPRRFATFAQFMVLEGLLRSPELRVFDAAIDAQVRALKTARRASRVPSLGVQAAVDSVLSRDGVGADGFGDLVEFDLPPIDDTSWTLGVSASLPLFSGGGLVAERVEAEIDLERLRLERTATEERLDQRIRSILEQMRASFIGIRFSEQSASAARENLQLVEDAYVRGAASLLDLLDAQTAALNAEEQAANALYDFLEDWLRVHRATNLFELVRNVEKQAVFVERLDEYFDRQGEAGER